MGKSYKINRLLRFLRGEGILIVAICLNVIHILVLPSGIDDAAALAMDSAMVFAKVAVPVPEDIPEPESVPTSGNTNHASTINTGKPPVAPSTPVMTPEPTAPSASAATVSTQPETETSNAAPVIVPVAESTESVDESSAQSPDIVPTTAITDSGVREQTDAVAPVTDDGVSTNNDKNTALRTFDAMRGNLAIMPISLILVGLGLSTAGVGLMLAFKKKDETLRDKLTIIIDDTQTPRSRNMLVSRARITHFFQ